MVLYLAGRSRQTIYMHGEEDEVCTDSVAKFRLTVGGPRTNGHGLSPPPKKFLSMLQYSPFCDYTKA